MAELDYKDQIRDANPSRQGHAVIDLDDFDGSFTGASDLTPEPYVAQAVPIVMSHVKPVDENEELRNEVRVLQKRIDQIEQQDEDVVVDRGDNGSTKGSWSGQKLLLGCGAVAAVGIALVIIYFAVWNKESASPAVSQAPTPASPQISKPVECAGFYAANTTSITTSDIQGPLPTCLGLLTALTELELRNDDDVMGLIPSELGLLTALTELKLYDNQLTGTIPSQLGQLTALMGLFLMDNRLTGTIPTLLGQLTALTALNLRDNRLTGTIPSEMGRLTALRLMHLINNRLTGTIPSPAFGQLTALTGLLLYNNQLTGTIPSKLGQLTELTSLWLQDNQMTGTIPPDLSQLTSLTSLRLENNQLTGSVPSFVAGIAKADVSGNNLTISA